MEKYPTDDGLVPGDDVTDLWHSLDVTGSSDSVFSLCHFFAVTFFCPAWTVCQTDTLSHASESTFTHCFVTSSLLWINKTNTSLYFPIPRGLSLQTEGPQVDAM